MSTVTYSEDFTNPDQDILDEVDPAVGARWVRFISEGIPGDRPTIYRDVGSPNGVAVIEAEGTGATYVLSAGDQLEYPLWVGGVSAKLIFECRLRSISEDLTGINILIGLATDHRTAADDIGVNAWFRVKPSTESSAQFAGRPLLYAETDDTATDTDDQDLNASPVHGNWYTFRIDCTDLANVKFYLNGGRVGSTVIFSLSAAPSDTRVQPYFRVDTTSDDDAAVRVELDSVTITHDRV